MLTWYIYLDVKETFLIHLIQNRDIITLKFISCNVFLKSVHRKPSLLIAQTKIQAVILDAYPAPPPTSQIQVDSIFNEYLEYDHSPGPNHHCLNSIATIAS